MSWEGVEHNPAKKRVEYSPAKRKSYYVIWFNSFKEKWEMRCFHLVCGFILKLCYGCGNSQSCSDLPEDRWLSDGDLRDEALLCANCSFTTFWVLLFSVVLVVWFHLPLIRKAQSTLADCINRIRDFKNSIFDFFSSIQAEKYTFLTSSASQMIQSWR